MYSAPQSPDGRIVTVRPGKDGGLEIEVAFPVPPTLRAQIEGREAAVIFAARSRIARLGIDVAPTSTLAWDGDHLGLCAEVTCNVPAYGVEPFLADALQPGVRVGRLVFCPAERRLGSDEIDQALRANQLQLPASYSIDYEGRFRIRPEGWVYDLSEPMSLAALTAILTRADGKDLLNRVQLRRAVDRIVLEPHGGIITSCSMFLHKHYVVLESEESPLGHHLEAVCLDPVSTRGTNVFLEFANRGDRRIVNPTVAAALYHAVSERSEPKRWYGSAALEPAVAQPEEEATGEYARLVRVFDRLEAPTDDRRYSHRLVAVCDDLPALIAGAEPQFTWRKPSDQCQPAVGADVSAQELRAALDDAHGHTFGTCILRDVSAGARATLLLGYFPNLVEHTEICQAALERKIERVIFRRASYEHGTFLSSRDHGRLADYATLGLQVFWCQDERQHVVTHEFRGLRGYFMEPHTVDRFKSSLIFAAYGSSKPLADVELAKVSRLIENLHALFGDDIAIMTGGGPGAMQQTTDIAQARGMLVGASFIETVDQRTNKTAEFYQTFQGRSRQARQRWFEVASFHLFFMGGVGTLEEVGLTLTDMKLGVIERSPLVFFGRHDGEHYWEHLRRQFATMVEVGRAPAWLQENVLVTDEPDEVARFYKRILELG